MLDGMLKYTLQTYLGHPGFLMRINGRVSQFPLCFHVFSAYRSPTSKLMKLQKALREQ